MTVAAGCATRLRQVIGGLLRWRLATAPHCRICAALPSQERPRRIPL